MWFKAMSGPWVSFFCQNVCGLGWNNDLCINNAFPNCFSLNINLTESENMRSGLDLVCVALVCLKNTCHTRFLCSNFHSRVRPFIRLKCHRMWNADIQSPPVYNCKHVTWPLKHLLYHMLVCVRLRLYRCVTQNCAAWQPICYSIPLRDPTNTVELQVSHFSLRATLAPKMSNTMSTDSHSIKRLATTSDGLLKIYLCCHLHYHSNSCFTKYLVVVGWLLALSQNKNTRFLINKHQ